MTKVNENPAEALPSSSILLIRDHKGVLEVLMQQRPLTMHFAAGAYVFPGGKVDEADYHASWSAMAGYSLGKDDAYKVSVIRELYEETGILLTSRGKTAAKREASALEFAKTLSTEGHTVDLDRLVPFSNWVTPTPLPRRYDTVFYLAKAPSNQDFGDESSETIKTLWVNPHSILSAWERDEIPLMFPTRLNLVKLAQETTVEAALKLAKETPLYKVLPSLESVDGVRKVRIPLAAGYGVEEATERELQVESTIKSSKL